jgi:hypothetical protein
VKKLVVCLVLAVLLLGVIGLLTVDWNYPNGIRMAPETNPDPKVTYFVDEFNSGPVRIAENNPEPKII